MEKDPNKYNKLKRGEALRHGAAIAQLGIAALNGMNMYDHNQEVQRAEAKVEAFTEVNAIADANEWQAYADQQESESDHDKMITGLGLTTASLFEVSALAARRERKKSDIVVRESGSNQ